MELRQARFELLALNVSGLERMFNGWAAACGEEKFEAHPAFRGVIPNA